MTGRLELVATVDGRLDVELMLRGHEVNRALA